MTMNTPRMSPAYLNAQYNNRLRVVNAPAILQGWQSRSQVARQQLSHHSGVTYGQHPREVLDVFPATTNAALAPVVVFVHGGYWRALSKDEHSFIAPALVSAGACVVVPSYPLCPQASLEDIALSLTQALAWVYRNIERYGADPTRITVVGHSAGGHLAAMLVNTLWPTVGVDLPPQLVRGAVAISGLYDLAPIMRTTHLQQDLQLTTTQVARLSPVNLPPSALNGAQLSCVVGGQESEEFVRQNTLMQRAWGTQHVPICEAYEGLNHFTVLDALTTPIHPLHQLVLSHLMHAQ
ncbi:MAG: alpha/beta hydrolase [Burkholderiales bacterium]